MRRIRKSSIVSYSNFGHFKVPSNIQTSCPKCGQSSNFSLRANYQKGKNGLLTEGGCSACKKESTFIIIKNESPDDSVNSADVYIYDPQSSKHPLNQIEKLQGIPADLLRAYRSALNVYQWKDNAATAVMSKRVIESIFKYYSDDKEKRQTLSEQIDRLPENIDLGKPIRYLDQLLRPDSPFSQMLELERDLDDETAASLMELLESLIDYLFVLPKNIEIAHDKIQRKNK